MPAVGKNFQIWGEKSGSRKKSGERIPFIYFILCRSFSFLHSVLQHQRLASLRSLSGSQTSGLGLLLRRGGCAGTQCAGELWDPLQSHATQQGLKNPQQSPAVSKVPGALR